MLFSSYEFLLVFLPVAVLGFALTGRLGIGARQAWLLGCSAFFYGVWNPVYLPLLGGSILANFLLAKAMLRQSEGSRVGLALLVVGIVGNLSLIGWFKYANFLLATAGAAVGATWSAGEIILPLAISFYTFQQIAFLVEARRQRRATGTLVEYALFVLFFPQLIAGPIVHHGEVLDQFRSRERFRLRWETTATGLAYFVTGLVKKVVLADTLAPAADSAFDAAAAGATLAPLDAWRGLLAYTLQLYFDFSGYSDMAIGLGWVFGVRLPVNFLAPYQATSSSDFWRRWHVTLSQFLRDYLYIPLGGSRCGGGRRSLNLLATMLLGGLWHGAGWTYVAWGAYHGGLLIVHALWSPFADRHGLALRTTATGRVAARTLTFLAVMLGWAIFRSADFAALGRMLTALAGWSAGPTSVWLERADDWLLIGLLAFVQTAPSTLRVIGHPDALVQPATLPRLWRRLAWRPTPLHGAGLGASLLLCLLLLTRVREFLYFQF